MHTAQCRALASVLLLSWQCSDGQMSIVAGGFGLGSATRMLGSPPVKTASILLTVRSNSSKGVPKSSLELPLRRLMPVALASAQRLPPDIWKLSANSRPSSPSHAELAKTPPTSRPAPSSDVTRGSALSAACAAARASSARALFSGATELRKRKSPPASLRGSGTCCS
eukprot:scaffold2706_cov109-Isochrysis_galbana.AAC.9